MNTNPLQFQSTAKNQPVSNNSSDISPVIFFVLVFLMLLFLILGCTIYINPNTYNQQKIIKNQYNQTLSCQIINAVYKDKTKSICKLRKCMQFSGTITFSRINVNENITISSSCSGSCMFYNKDDIVRCKHAPNLNATCLDTEDFNTCPSVSKSLYNFSIAFFILSGLFGFCFIFLLCWRCERYLKEQYMSATA